MLSGPIIGSLLYELGGFKLPFFVVGVALFALILPIKFYVTEDKRSSEINIFHEATHPPRNVLPLKKLSFFSILCKF